MSRFLASWFAESRYNVALTAVDRNARVRTGSKSKSWVVPSFLNVSLY